MTACHAYVICTSPRSGSTLLCTMLRATGVAGYPESWFYESSLVGWCEDLGVTPDLEATEQDTLRRVFHAAIAKGSAGGGPFALRQQAASLPFLPKQLAVLVPCATSDTERFGQVFGQPVFIYLNREDKVAQAVSWLRAEQTGLWHAAPDGTDIERKAPHREPVYDADRLHALVEKLTGFHDAWETWFAAQRVRPLRLTYTEVSITPLDVLRRVLSTLGLDPAAADTVGVGTRKLADEMNDHWASWYRSDNPHA